jgi:ribosomal protein L32
MNLSTAGRRLINSLAEDLAQEQETPFLHNSVYDGVPEDETLVEICEAYGRAKYAHRATSDRDRMDVIRSKTSKARKELREAAQERAREVAEECVEDAEQWREEHPEEFCPDCGLGRLPMRYPEHDYDSQCSVCDRPFPAGEEISGEESR